MAWTVEISSTAEKQISKLAREAQARIVQFLRQKVQAAKDPRQLGRPLHGEFAGLWRYRVGAYRIICEIQEHRLVVMVVRVAHRGRAYR